MVNQPGFIDSFDVVVRVNNYKIVPPNTGRRTDVFYSYFGNAVKKPAHELVRDGVRLCMCKCPNDKTIDSQWHENRGKTTGIDFRWIYEKRKAWWFCPTYIPTKEDFLTTFYLLGKHVPTTGFSAIVDILGMSPKEIYLTGFDFFTSRKHNINEPWRSGDPGDPIGHVPERELEWVRVNMDRYEIKADAVLFNLIHWKRRAVP